MQAQEFREMSGSCSKTCKWRKALGFKYSTGILYTRLSYFAQALWARHHFWTNFTYLSRDLFV